MTIAGLDPSGGAGIIADVKTMMAFGCFPTAAVTALTFQNTTGVFGIRKQSAADVIAQIMPVIDDLGVDAVKTGMLPTAGVIRAVADLVAAKKLPRPVVDPVIVSTSGHRLISAPAFRVLMKDLLPLAVLVTPNIPEAEVMIRRRISSVEEMVLAAKEIHELGAPVVLLKGGHLGGDKAIDLLWEKGKAHYFSAPRVDTTSTHGTGCTLSAAIAAGLAGGRSLRNAIGEAKAFVHQTIVHAPGLGKGNGPVDHGWQIAARGRSGPIKPPKR
jgi:hydroxymethylpyrimidine/phosphomethylpyrimidine kinase